MLGVATRSLTITQHNNMNTKECPYCHRHYPVDAETNTITPHRALVRNKPRGCGYPRVKSNITVEEPVMAMPPRETVSPIGHILTLRLPGQGNVTLLGRCLGESTTHVEVACNAERPDLGEWFSKKFVL